MSTRKWLATCSSAALALALAGGAVAADDTAAKATGQQQAMADVKDALKVSKIDGMKVNGPDGKEVGSLSEAFFDPSTGQISHVVLSKGGTFGIGGEQYLVPWDQINIDKAQDLASIKVSEEQFSSEFSAYEEVEEQREQAQEQQDQSQEQMQEQQEQTTDGMR